MMKFGNLGQSSCINFWKVIHIFLSYFFYGWLLKLKAYLTKNILSKKEKFSSNEKFVIMLLPKLIIIYLIICYFKIINSKYFKNVLSLMLRYVSYPVGTLIFKN